MKKSVRLEFYFIAIALFFLCGYVWHSVFVLEHENTKLKVAVLDIGQGDSIYVEAPNGRQMLIDGGRTSKILSRLSEVMPFGDRSIDVLVVTNPDADHFAGFINVLENYDVGMVMESGTVSTSKTYKAFVALLAEKKIPDVLARSGMDVLLDAKKNVHMEILFPDRDVSHFTHNDGSIVSRLIYGATSVMLTGDATKHTENILVSKYPKEELESTILKVGHHGSRTSSGASFVKAVAPKYSVISDGKNNSYGHPHKETLDTLLSAGVKILRTDELGTIVFQSDGIEFMRRYQH